jgi:hypothetical protein
MDWTYEKYLRDQELEEIEDKYSGRYRIITDLISESDIDAESLDYSVRSANQISFSSVAGFNQHPNSSQEM